MNYLQGGTSFVNNINLNLINVKIINTLSFYKMMKTMETSFSQYDIRESTTISFKKCPARFKF